MAFSPPGSGRFMSIGGSSAPGFNPQVGDVDPITGLTYHAPPSKYGTGASRGFTPGRGLSVGQIYARREGKPNARYADGTPVPAGMRINHAGWNTSGVGPGTRGYRGSGVIGSAAGAVGSPGVPTSQKGRAEKYGDAFAGIPTWMMSNMMREGAGGLSQDWALGDMGRLPAPAPVFPVPPARPNPLLQEAGDFRAVEQPVPTWQSNDTGSDWFRSLLSQFIPGPF